jgi:lanosterol synthase
VVAPALRLEAESSTALERGVDVLARMQRADGSWEGECVWCPMLTAQYAITAHVIGLEVSPERRRGMLRHFRTTQNDAGVWGLHPRDEGSLFVTTLAYVASRLLGALPTEPWLQGARRMFEREEGAQRIPTWGKVWLALLDLYSWEGVNPILPEVWALPTWFPLHPASYYCHTRAIYLGLAVLYGERFVARPTPITDALRAELYPDGYSTIDFAAHAEEVREEDAPFLPSPALRALFGVARRYERFHSRSVRRRLLGELRETMRRDLRASDYLSLSPVNGLLSILALWADDPRSSDLGPAVDRFDAWFWEDAREGSRVAGAGSICWDTSFALQALATAPDARASLAPVLDGGAAFLVSQQIERPTFDYRRAHRIDPSGGWCFSEVGHGWPVSDCTAEAVLALLDSRPHELGREHAARAVRFILRCQNRDGGFGSYEPEKTRFPLEWMNPAEMFGRCMTERSYVECTASCLMALTAVHDRYPDLMRQTIREAVGRASRFLVRSQNVDGTWNAAWGVRYVYATMFGVRGLLAAGIPATDERIRKACRWLLARQRADGGWGEQQPKARAPGYVGSDRSSAVQTAWALIALVEAAEPDEAALRRAKDCLEHAQLPSGEWPDGEFVGVFFETALLNYRLYRQHFPVMALALYQRRNTARTP